MRGARTLADAPARRTRQRDAIALVLAEAARPMSPAEILAAARRRVHSLGQATVYRSIAQLVELGEAVAVVLPGQPPRYELARAAAKHHHHFHCDSCDRVFDVHGCAPGLDALAPRGFSVARHDVVLYGTCADCG